MDSAELYTLSDYCRAIMELFFAWKTTSSAFHRAVEDDNNDTDLQGYLDRFGELRLQALTFTVPEHAALIQRALNAALQSGQAYFRSVFDDADDAVIGQYARDYQEELTMFISEFERLLRVSGRSS